MKTPYVVGLAFNAAADYAVLVLKNKPEWQAGCLNGIGGKIEEGEHARAAMVREFKEEAGIYTSPLAWRHFGRMTGPKFEVAMFVIRDDYICGNAHSCTDEQIVVTPLDDLKKFKLISNLEWMIWAALDLNGGRPPFFDIQYDDPVKV